MFESRVLRKIFGPKSDWERGNLKRLYTIIKSFMILTVHRILFGVENKQDMGGTCDTYGEERWF